MDSFKIRLATEDDAEGVRLAHRSSVFEIASKDYPQEVLTEWVGEQSPESIQRFGDAIRSGREIVWVAEISGVVVGFFTLVPEREELRAVYVSGGAARMGIGKALLKVLESKAQELKLRKLSLLSTVTAKDFYEKSGYANLGEGLHAKRSGKKMKCFKMEKIFYCQPGLLT